MQFASLIGPALAGFMQMLAGGQQTQLPPGYLAGTRGLKDALAYDTNLRDSVPGSQPQEQAALSQAKGLAGGDLANSYQQLLVALGPNAQGAPGTGDAVGRFGLGASAQLGGLDMQSMLNALLRRDQANQQAAGISGQLRGGNVGPQYIQPPNLGAMFGQLGQAFARQQGQQQFGAPGGTAYSFPQGGSYGGGNGPQYGAPGTDWGEGLPPLYGSPYAGMWGG